MLRLHRVQRATAETSGRLAHLPGDLGAKRSGGRASALPPEIFTQRAVRTASTSSHYFVDPLARPCRVPMDSAGVVDLADHRSVTPSPSHAGRSVVAECRGGGTYNNGALSPSAPLAVRYPRRAPFTVECAPDSRRGSFLLGPGSGLSSQRVRACHARNVRAGRWQATLTAGARFQRGRAGPLATAPALATVSGEQGNL